MGSTAERVKTTAIVIAYLASFMVVAIPVGMAPTDSTPDTTAAETHEPTLVEYDFDTESIVTGDPLEVDDSIDTFRVINIPQDIGGTDINHVAITEPSGDTDCTTYTAEKGETTTDDDGSGTQTAEFLDITFETVSTDWGIQYRENSGGADVACDALEVEGVNDITVDINVAGTGTNESTFESGNIQVRTTTTWDANGSAVEGADVTVVHSGDGKAFMSGTTNNDGKFSFSHNFNTSAGADVYTVTVEFPGSGSPKHQDEAQFTIHPAEPELDSKTGFPATSGFSSTVTYDFSYPATEANPFGQRQMDKAHLVNYTVRMLEDGADICTFSQSSTGASAYTAEWNNDTDTLDAGTTSTHVELDLTITNINVDLGAGAGTTAVQQVGLFAPGNADPVTDPANADYLTDVEDGTANPTSAVFEDIVLFESGSWDIHYYDGAGNEDPAPNDDTAVDTLPATSQTCTDPDDVVIGQDGSVSFTHTWVDGSDYKVKVHGENAEPSGGAQVPYTGKTQEYKFVDEFTSEDAEPPVLSLNPEEGDVPDRLGLTPPVPVSPTTGETVRPNGAEGTPNDDTLLNPSSAGPTGDGNGQYTLTIQGTSATDHPEPADLDIDVSGPFLGEPVFTDSAGTELDFTETTGTSVDDDGIIQVRQITPMRGRSKITFDVTWDHPTEDKVSDKVVHHLRQGTVASVSPSEVTVGQDTTVTVHVTGTGGTPIPDADVTLFWSSNGTQLNQTSGNDTAGFGQGGDYTFDLDIDQDVGFITAQADDQFDKDSFTEFEVVPAHDLDTDVSPDGDLAGRDTEYTLNVTRNGDAFDDAGDDVDIHVLNEDQWDEFQKNGSSALPMPLAASEYSRDGEGNFTFDWRAPPGTYYVYVSTAPKGLHDNQGQVPTIELERAEISWDPEVLVSKVDRDITVTVHLHDPTADSHDDSELNGTLAVQTGAVNFGNGDGLPNATFANSSHPLNVSRTVATDTGGTKGIVMNETSIDVTNGDAHIDNVTAQRPGPVHAWFEDDSTGAVFALTGTPLQVRAPDISLTPDLVCVGVTTQVTATVTHPVTGDAITGASFVLRQGGVKVANGSTNMNGIARVTVFLTNSTQVKVQINGDTAGTFSPKNCMSISFDEETYTEGDTVGVTVSQRGNPDVQIQGANILLNGNQVGTTGSDGSMTFDAPSAGDHLVRAKKSGFADATADFTTESATPPAQFSVSGVSVEDADTYLVDNTYTVTGTVTNNGGESGSTNVQFLVDGAVQDSTTLTLSAGGSQQVAFQFTPSSTGDVSVAIAADGDSRSTAITVEEEEPTVPGFEVVAVLAALGAAAVVLRRD